MKNKQAKQMMCDNINAIWKYLPHPNDGKTYGLLASLEVMPVTDHFSFTRRYYRTVSLTAEQIKGNEK